MHTVAICLNNLQSLKSPFDEVALLSLKVLVILSASDCAGCARWSRFWILMKKYTHEEEKEQSKCVKQEGVGDKNRSNGKFFKMLREEKCFKCRPQQIMYRVIRIQPLYVCLLYVTCGNDGNSFNHNLNNT